MTRLENIQENTSEFNIKFHLKMCIAEAMMQVFLINSNKEKMEAAMKIKTEPFDARDIIIGSMFDGFVKQYLAESFDGEE